MNTLCMESGFVSLNKQGEDLCGDFFTTVSDDDATTFVLSDGMGSGVKANILATLTAKILATMTANHLSIRDSVTTLAQTLPVCSVRKVAYSTFTLMQVLPDWQVYLAQFDNPQAILLRDGKSLEYPTQELMVGDKRILESRLTLQSGDVFLLMTDGVTHAGLGNLIPDGWQREGVLQYVEEIYTPEISAKNLAARVADACRDGSAGLVLLAADLSPKSRKEAVRTAEQHGVRWFDAPFTMQEVEALLHKRAGILAVSDKGFVKMFEKHLPEQKKEDQIV